MAYAAKRRLKGWAAVRASEAAILRLAMEAANAACDLAVTWRSRAALAMMSERDLMDLGLLRCDVRYEPARQSRPWRGTREIRR
jgi:uncharacterized protein YjiS (DUF1127 family)